MITSFPETKVQAKEANYTKLKCILIDKDVCMKWAFQFGMNKLLTIYQYDIKEFYNIIEKAPKSKREKY